MSLATCLGCEIQKMKTLRGRKIFLSERLCAGLEGGNWKRPSAEGQEWFCEQLWALSLCLQLQFSAAAPPSRWGEDVEPSASSAENTPAGPEQPPLLPCVCAGK